MMNVLHELEDTSRVRKRVQRVGRGVGSGRGKTSTRGQKGYGSRSGYRVYAGREGGQMPLYRKLPKRGFSNVQFQDKPLFILNLDRIHEMFQDGDVVSEITLRERGIIRGANTEGLKVLGKGVCTKKVIVEAQSVSAGAIEKLSQAGIAVTVMN
ncbi:MAG: 50S ribosomal protein L15 [Chlamydiia bacterium]